MVDLTLCQVCKINPAVYGDGLTWSRCAACQQKSKPEVQQEGFKHEIVSDLTSIIIPVYMSSYTLFHYTGNCIGSLREHTKEKYELIIVDNGSPIQPPTLNSYYAHKVIKNEKNLGVTKAWNQGIRASQGEVIVLLNNDVLVYDHWLSDLKEALNEGYDLAMAHPMYSLTEPFSRARESKRIRDMKLQSGQRYSDFKDFSCVAIKRSLLNEIGTFDERFMSYAQDSDFFNRMEEADKKWTCVETVATSHISDATGFSIEDTPNIMNRDKDEYAKKWEDVDREIEETLGAEKRLVRTSSGGDALFLIERGKYHHVKDPQTLKALGFKFGDEEVIPTEEFNEFENGGTIDKDNYKEYV